MLVAPNGVLGAGCQTDLSPPIRVCLCEGLAELCHRCRWREDERLAADIGCPGPVSCVCV